SSPDPKACQPTFFKKITALSKPLFLKHQPDFHPANSADLLTNQHNVNPFSINQRTKQPAASSDAALVVAIYRPQHSKLSTTKNRKMTKYFSKGYIRPQLRFCSCRTRILG